MLTAEKKHSLIQEYQVTGEDTGSSEIQVALLTERINQITGHLRLHKGDKHSRLGLMKLVGRRRRLLRYLSGESVERYKALISRLGLRR